MVINVRRFITFIFIHTEINVIVKMIKIILKLIKNQIVSIIYM